MGREAASITRSIERTCRGVTKPSSGRARDTRPEHQQRDPGFTDVVALVNCNVSGISPGDSDVGSQCAARSHSAANHATRTADRVVRQSSVEMPGSERVAVLKGAGLRQTLTPALLSRAFTLSVRVFRRKRHWSDFTREGELR
jgi:hypothetical protein